MALGEAGQPAGGWGDLCTPGSGSQQRKSQPGLSSRGQRATQRSVTSHNSQVPTAQTGTRGSA